ncbi:MAG: aminotransferase class V-fold PLP-dependent enzyme, partial [Gaiellaceae bacterium]
VDLLYRRLEGLLDGVRAELGAFVGADPEGIVFLPNATAGVNAVARSLGLEPGDEVLSTDHEYGAMGFTWQDVCARAGATWVPRPVRVPCTSAEEIVEAVWGGVTGRTRVLFVSHIGSPTAIRFPVEELCRRAREAGIVSVVDGAHGPGQLDLDLDAIGADFYAGNRHKWLCAPKGCGFLAVRPEMRALLRPNVVSWGVHSERFVERHGWQGTDDPSAFLALPAAIGFHREQLAPARAACHALLEEWRPRLGTPLTPPGEEWFGQMAAVELPPCHGAEVRRRLWDEHRIEVVADQWNDRPLLRVSVHVYNTRDDLQRLEAAL